ncbi:MAG: rRNA pseudouridine synthase [Acidobacteria bacterium]|nr:rRNA pseudouridine synthase [Acidobacteriota bacterium]
MPEERLQKIIARSGLCSRRDAEGMIAAGRVTVNGHTAKLGTKADPAVDHIKVDGRRIKAPAVHRYVLIYKPRGVMTTCEDPEERMTVLDLVRGKFKERLFPVGRLDYQSEGLLILTNDGELAARITHPRYGVVREYKVKVKGDLRPEEVGRVRRGARIEGHLVCPRSVVREKITAKAGNSWWRVEVSEGRTHEVRELFFRAGHPVQRLRRTAIGPIRDPQLPPGAFRELTEQELGAVRRVCGLV